ncbi:MAG: cyclase family protein [Anaerolineae bacterium]|jgi:arylformamidase|nr:cyclase family protein [Anaerolineae bacterium]PKO03275.1 MAG: cyclase [Chloroflexi bacterium HGW-Chloroflexi-5]
MKIFDVSLTIREGMAVWPGENPVVLNRRTKIEEGAHANVSFLSLGAHTGTHVDAPFHFIADGSKVDEMPLEVLIGPAQVVEVPDVVKVINAEVLAGLKIADEPKRILFKTSNSHYWDLDTDEFQTGFVGIDLSASEELVKRGMILVGIDYLSASPYKISKPTHDELLGAQMIIIEGLDLRKVQAGFYTLYCLPLKLHGADGAPARVILIQE